MHILKRRVGQAVRIVPAPDLDPSTPVGELFADNTISIVLAGVNTASAQLIVFGDGRLLAVEDERCMSPNDEPEEP